MDQDFDHLSKEISLRITFGLQYSNTSFRENDFRNASVYPSSKELVTPQRTNKLNANRVKGPYKTVYDYLNTHFCLLREDFLKPIRENICSFLKNADVKLLNVRIHEVQFIRKGVKHAEVCHCLEIKKSMTHYSWNFKKNPKRFLMGSLLLFTKDNFKTIICGRVADNRNMVYRKILVSFEQPVNLACEQKYVMIECNTFFEPYYNVLKVLQTTPEDTFAMQKYLVEVNSSVEMPKYLNNVKHTVSDIELNKSQVIAMNGALSQELAIIQGPPGTGKTFLGLKIAKELLCMSKKWYCNSPMLVISFTNHALDQFLEGLPDSTDKILRFGGQSRNSKMKNYSIRECRRRYYESNVHRTIEKRRFAPIYRDYCTIKKKIGDMGNQIDNINTSKPTCIFYFNVLSGGVPEMKEWFASQKNENFVSWLLEDDGTMTVKDENRDVCEAPLTSKENGLIGDSKKMADLYINFLRDVHKGSKYCLISVSIMDKAAIKLREHITETTKGIEKKKTKYKSIVKLKVVKKYLREIVTLEETHKYLARKIEYLKICLKTEFNNKVDRESVDFSHPFKMPVRVRWQLYKYWLSQYEIYMKEKMEIMITEYKPIYENFIEAQERNDLAIMRDQKIIGMTTTSAARLHSTIKALKCPIVIVEEAAEVLEAHIIPVLTEHCQHLILIGDHQQLKPTTADFEIETRYKLGISMFERMVINNMQCYTLNVQHRMRPEISSLITPSIYPVLNDHESVKHFPSVAGVDMCLYFISHTEPDQGAGDCSKKNIHEVKFLIQLASYLIKNGYEPKDITILAAYLGQASALLQEQRECLCELVKNVKISSVDNFQGEENKVILLSLVRSNPQKKIGFLSIENRVCVALSRAKEGLYVMGNMNQLSTCSKLWQKIRVSFERQNALGAYLPLKCQNHGHITNVTIPEDFETKAPNGGCDQKCNGLLSCGHNCQRFCHNDDLLHLKYKCAEPCSRSLCKNVKHGCPKLCYQPCGLCTYSLRQKLPCGHYIKCFMNEMEDYRCQEMVYIGLQCGHKFGIICNEVDSDYEDDLECPICKSSSKKEEDSIQSNFSNFENTLDEMVESMTVFFV